MKLVNHYVFKLFRRSFSNPWIAGMLVVAFSTIFTAALLKNLSILEVAENYFSDLRVALLSSPRPQSERIAVILIDEASLDEVSYRSPIDRKFITELIDELESRSVAAIGLNVRFDRPTEPYKDQMLHDRLRNLELPVVVSMVSDRTGFTEKQIAYSRSYLGDLSTGLSLIFRDSIDHTVRASLLRLTDNGESQLGFTATLAESVGIELPENDRIYIDYRPGPDPWTPPFPVYSARDVSALPIEALRNRIVLIGPDVGRILRLRTPFSVMNKGFAKDLPGVMIEAQVLSQLIENRSLRMPTELEKIFYILIMAAAGCLLSLMRVNLLTKLVLPLAILPIAWIGALMLYIVNGMLVPIVMPTISFIVAMIVTSFWLWRNEALQRERVHTTFGKYLAPTVVEQLLDSPEEVDLGGEVREISFLFTDLEGFTRLTETTLPRVMVGLVNSYLEEACDIVASHGGTIDKIVGDALHVMFNAPLLQIDHATRAVKCALELDRWSEGFRQRHHEQGIDLGMTRIGINTGSCIVGNFGSKSRFDYTAHGDAINSAARLEAINQRLGTSICVSESTVEKCEGIYFRTIATLVLRGKTEGIKAYTPIMESTVDDTRSLLYEKAYELLEEKHPAAEPLFAELSRLYPQDPLVKLHWKRIKKGINSTVLVISKK